jgi:hypothetical protein
MFVQTLSFTCHDEDALMALFDEWGSETAGEIGYWQSVVMKDRDKPDCFTVWVQFPSYEEAMRNSERPETDASAKKLFALVDGEVEYRNYDLVGGAASVIGPGN